MLKATDYTKLLDIDKAREFLRLTAQLIGLERRKADLLHEMMLGVALGVKPRGDTKLTMYRHREMVTADFGSFIQIHARSHYGTLEAQRDGDQSLPVLKSFGLIMVVAREGQDKDGELLQGDDYECYMGRKHLGTRRELDRALSLFANAGQGL